MGIGIGIRRETEREKWKRLFYSLAATTTYVEIIYVWIK